MVCEVEGCRTKVPIISRCQLSDWEVVPLLRLGSRQAYIAQLYARRKYWNDGAERKIEGVTTSSGGCGIISYSRLTNRREIDVDFTGF